ALAAEARALADDLRAALREQGQTAPAARALALALMLCGATAGCRGPADPELAAAVEGLEADFLAASTPAEFRAVAERFEARLASAPPSGPLLFNLGNAWARAGERARAVAAYRQAKLWLPRDPHLDHNLRVALDGAPALEQRGGVMTKIAFWSTLISANELAWITAVLAVFAFASALLALAVRHPAAGMVRNGALVLFLAIGLAFLWLRREQAPGHFGVIASDAVEARTGNAASYEPAFTEPLRVATEFEVLDQRGGWIRLRLPGGAEGWVPDAAARVY
ncbi:MAG TPA: SH3 domain-containing protein, partial [Planctomycetota bacterium]